jgi:hypothetical protein
MSPEAALQILTRAVTIDGVDRAEVSLALATLEARAKIQWPFRQFREAFNGEAVKEVEKERRRQVLNAALTGIRRAVVL